MTPRCACCSRRRAPRGVILVSDGTSATGMPDGTYRLGTFEVTVSGGVSRSADGKLAGSTLTLDRALRNMVDARCAVRAMRSPCSRQIPRACWGSKRARARSRRAPTPTWFCSTQQMRSGRRDDARARLARRLRRHAMNGG